MMNFDEYVGKFTLAAINNGHDLGYVTRCIEYARPLAEKGLPIIYKPPIFDNLLTFSNDYSHYFGEVTN